jgi:hypothetical protein
MALAIAMKSTFDGICNLSFFNFFDFQFHAEFFGMELEIEKVEEGEVADAIEG